MKAFRLALRYVLHHRVKTSLMILCVVLTVLLPVALGILLQQFNRQIVARAVATPLVVGAPGSRLDLAMHALYFKTPVSETIPWGVRSEVKEFGKAVPLHVRVTASRYPVVGTSLEYFEYRGIRLHSGDGLTRLGDCVLGWNVASQLGLASGDTLLTDRTNVFDIAGNYPLKMHVRGVLQRMGTPDDDAVFIDIKTAWVIEGYGHGHQDVTQVHDDNLVLERDDDSVTASAAVLPYTEITDDNISSFHFHGDFDEFPVTAVIAVPADQRSSDLLMGRLQQADASARICRPIDEVEQLMGLVFRVQRFFMANAALIAVSTVLLLGLVMALAIQLREQELNTMFRIGCSRGMIVKLVSAELTIVFVSAAVIVAASAWLISRWADDIVIGLMS